MAQVAALSGHRQHIAFYNICGCEPGIRGLDYDGAGAEYKKRIDALHRADGFLEDIENSSNVQGHPATCRMPISQHSQPSSDMNIMALNDISTSTAKARGEPDKDRASARFRQRLQEKAALGRNEQRKTATEEAPATEADTKSILHYTKPDGTPGIRRVLGKTQLDWMEKRAESGQPQTESQPTLFSNFGSSINNEQDGNKMQSKSGSSPLPTYASVTRYKTEPSLYDRYMEDTVNNSTENRRETLAGGTNPGGRLQIAGAVQDQDHIEANGHQHKTMRITSDRVEETKVHGESSSQAKEQNTLKSPEAYTRPFCDFLTENPTVWHAVQYFEKKLDAAGFKKVLSSNNIF